jgi:hypothetical protein
MIFLFWLLENKGFEKEKIFLVIRVMRERTEKLFLLLNTQIGS